MISEEDQVTMIVGNINFSTDLGSCNVVIESNEESELYFSIRNDKEDIQIKAFKPEYKNTTRYLNDKEKEELQQFLESKHDNTINDEFNSKLKDSNWNSIIGMLNIISYGDYPEQDNFRQISIPNYNELKEN